MPRIGPIGVPRSGQAGTGVDWCVEFVDLASSKWFWRPGLRRSFWACSSPR